jgi:hypothetical protein
MWSYNARERRPQPTEPADSSYDGQERLVSRSKNHQEKRPTTGTDSKTSKTTTRNREEQGS